MAKILEKLFATEFMWIISAAILSFPLGLIPLACVDLMIADYDEFILRIDDQIILLYLLMVIACFLGILIMRFSMSAIKVLLRPEEDKENEEE